MKIKPGDIVRFKKSFGGDPIEDCRIIYFISRTKRGRRTYHTGINRESDLALEDKNIIKVIEHRKIPSSKYYRRLHKLNEIINRTPTYYPDYEENNYWYWSDKRMETLWNKFEIKKEKALLERSRIIKYIVSLAGY